MRKINKPNRTGFFALLLSLLGIGGCDAIENEIGGLMPLMYGSPTAQYSIKGKVTDEDGKEIPDLEVTFSGMWTDDAGYSYTRPIAAPVKTDAQGRYDTDMTGFPCDRLQVKVVDNDGPLNGGDFASDSTTVYVEFKKDKKDKNPWYHGEADVTVPSFKLKKK